jgi:hypothetical protein
MASTTSDVIESAHQLAMEVRIRAGMMRTDYRRGNLARLRRARKAAERLARLAADLASAAFSAADLLDAEIRGIRNKADE